MEGAYASLLASMGAEVWEITKNQAYEVLAVRTSPLQVSEHEANAKVVNALFAGISRAEFSRVQGFQEAHKVWMCLENYHEGTPQVKARLFKTHRHEYENFTQEPGESIDLMFSRFQSIVNKVSANRSGDALDYTEHEKALKLHYALDCSVWDLKVNTVIESAGYETLIVNELFSKLKATEMDNQTRDKLNGAPPSKSIALVTGPGGSSSNANYALAFLLPLCLLLQMNS